MNAPNAVPSNGKATEPIMVVVPVNGGGFQVYPSSNPAAVAFVGGTAASPTCTCAEFRSDAHEWGRCAHVAAVFAPADAAPYAASTRDMPPHASAVANGNGLPEPVQLVIKRSVSPDGRIDSLSVEVHQSVQLEKTGQAVQNAVNTLLLEDQIVGFFLQRGPSKNGNNGHANGHNAIPGNGHLPQGTDPVSAELTHIGGMQTKRGYSLFLNIRVNGQEARVFGSAQKLAGYISDAGYRPQNFPIVANQRLGLQCLAILDQKTNSKYPVIERVLPQSNMAGTGGGR